MTPPVEDLTASATEAMLGPNPFVGLRSQDVLEALRQIVKQAVREPGLVLELQATLARELIAVLAGKSKVTPPAGDKRFADPAWQTNPVYRMFLQGYVAWADTLKTFVERSALDTRSKQRAEFGLSLLTEAMAPTNTLLGNPAAVKKLVDSGGANLIDGLKNMLSDLAHNHGMPAQVDKSAFRLSGNIAQSQGAVVFRNEVLELIQYEPLTKEVYTRPQLIVPPQINKFYIFDLAPNRSIVEYLLKHGLQTFVVSWRNPTPQHHDWDLSTYVGALHEAIAVVREITGSDDLNVHAACSGAVTIAALLGHLAATGQPSVHAATLMVAVLGNSSDSQLGLFATEEAIAAAKQGSAANGVLEGREMARVFAWMRPTDLVWNYWVNNYLLGNSPPAFDILFWNNDTTRLPARFHGQLLDIFGDNPFRKPGDLKILGTPIDLSKVVCDKYVVAGMTDHITPWKGVYETARAFGGKSEFVLSSSGHIQSLINPPGNPKARFYAGTDLPDGADEWLAGSRAVSGSWWDHWREWVTARSGAIRSAPASPGSRRHPPQGDAPGTYVIEP
jgi:polyhydroxyalkanoate synthase subunit PhaC